MDSPLGAVNVQVKQQCHLGDSPEILAVTNSQSLLGLEHSIGLGKVF